MSASDVVVVGSGAGGGTISWLLAKAGLRVVLLEQGGDLAAEVETFTPSEDIDLALRESFNPTLHDEYRFMVERPDPKRRLRGAYNTFRTDPGTPAAPLKGMGGFTGTTLGGGSVLWGGWTFRALPIDLRLRTHFRALGQLDLLEKRWDYSVPDWPIGYDELEPFYNVAEVLFAVCGSRGDVN